MIDSLFSLECVREKHRQAPMLVEREKYLSYLAEIGVQQRRLKLIANMLIHVVRLLEIEEIRPIDMVEIRRGCQLWVQYSSVLHHHTVSKTSFNSFKLAAINWLRFHGCLREEPKQAPRFNDLLTDFLRAMQFRRGLSPITLKSYGRRIAGFLQWLQPRCSHFSEVRVRDIEAYIDAKQLEGWSRRSISIVCSTLRTFFEYAEQQGWCTNGIRASILGPRIPRVAENLAGPSWRDVQRIIASISAIKPADLRAKAMVLLFSIYGFRSAEVTRMNLEDIDWRRGTITVRRAKRGRIQQFPLQSEVGEAIALYLKKARPKCPCRRLFVTLHPPFRPVEGHSMSAIIGTRIKKAGIEAKQFGPHSLRRACATRLLRTGTSLREIADFLGHRDLRSVANYAKYDPDSLKMVADFSLRGVL